jgi:hypothetical protein
MTIAAGILYTSGILLCSYSQIEQGNNKTYGSKMGFFDCPDGRLAYALAGASEFALSAVQKVRNSIVYPNEDFYQRTERILGDEYRRVVFDNPLYLSAPMANSYSFLLILFTPTERPRLFVTTENSMRHAINEQHLCIGGGLELAKTVLGSAGSGTLPRSENQAILTAAHMLGVVKRNVPGCGGASQYLLIENDGTARAINVLTPETFEYGSQHLFDVAIRQLRFDCGDATITDERFEQSLMAQNAAARIFRQQCRQAAAAPNLLFNNAQTYPFPYTAPVA